jgi:hypothetical protein
MTAFGVGAGLALLAAGAFALIAPKIAKGDNFGEGVHVINIGDGDRGSFHLKDDALDIDAEWKGEFAFAADGRSLSSLKGVLDIKSKEKGVTRKVAFSNRDADISPKVYLNDKLQPDGEESEKIAADLLQLFARSSSVNADSRINALVAEGGKEAAIAEIGNLAGGHAIGAYVEALAKSTKLTPADARGLAEKINGVDSDYAKRKAVVALLKIDNLDDAAMTEILHAAKAIKGDHELRLIVEELVEKPLADAQFETVATLIKDMDGDHEVRLAVSSLIESENVSDEIAAKALRLAAESIESDYELRLAIESANNRLANGQLAAAAIAAVGAVKGAHDRRLAVEDIAGSLAKTSAHWPGLIDSVAGIDDDFERRLAIEEIASNAPADADVKSALKSAAAAIKSDHERKLALQAVEE